jgi:hypothetical protein
LVPSKNVTFPDAPFGKVEVNVTGASNVDGFALEIREILEGVVARPPNGLVPVVGLLVIVMGPKDAPP